MLCERPHNEPDCGFLLLYSDLIPYHYMNAAYASNVLTPPVHRHLSLVYSDHAHVSRIYSYICVCIALPFFTLSRCHRCRFVVCDRIQVFVLWFLYLLNEYATKRHMMEYAAHICTLCPIKFRLQCCQIRLLYSSYIRFISSSGKTFCTPNIKFDPSNSRILFAKYFKTQINKFKGHVQL